MVADPLGTGEFFRRQRDLFVKLRLCVVLRRLSFGPDLRPDEWPLPREPSSLARRSPERLAARPPPPQSEVASVNGSPSLLDDVIGSGGVQGRPRKLLDELSLVFDFQLKTTHSTDRVSPDQLLLAVGCRFQHQ